MSESRFHGVHVWENTDLVTAINDIESSVIGMVAVVDDADANTPVLLTRVNNVLGKAGSLYKTLKAIADHSAYACGLRALIDNQQGWHKSLSNVGVSHVLGILHDVFWSLQAEESDANALNNKDITTLIKRNGFRFWGNRTTDTNASIFEGYTRTAQILADTIAEAQFEAVDGPLTPTNVKDVASGIHGKLSALVTQ